MECESEKVINGTCQECGSEGNQIKNLKEDKKMNKSKGKNKVTEVIEKKAEAINTEIDNLFEEIKEEEVKEEEVVEVKEEVKPVVNNDNNYDIAFQIIKNEIHINPELKITETDNASGKSYFSGRTRLFKLLKTKRGVSLEINVQLPKEFLKEITGIEDISKATAHLKHMGTMKHHYRSSNSNEIIKIVSTVIATFKQNIKKEEIKKSIQEVEITAKAI
jgi:hypothetical protein